MSIICSGVGALMSLKQPGCEICVPNFFCYHVFFSVVDSSFIAFFWSSLLDVYLVMIFRVSTVVVCYLDWY